MTITYTCTFDEFRQARNAVRASAVLAKKRTARTQILAAVFGVLIGGWLLVAWRLAVSGNPLGFHLLMPAVGFVIFSFAVVIPAIRSVRQFVRVIGGWILFAACGVMLLLLQPHRPSWRLLEPHWGWFGLLGLLALMSLYQRGARKAWAAQPHLHEPYTLETSLQGVVISNARSRNEYHWLSFTDVLETKDVLLMMLSPTNFHPVPKRAFADPRQLEEFRDQAAVIKARKLEGFAVIPLAQRAATAAESPP
jgi:hypothetical protein